MKIFNMIPVWDRSIQFFARATPGPPASIWPRLRLTVITQKCKISPLNIKIMLLILAHRMAFLVLVKREVLFNLET